MIVNVVINIVINVVINVAYNVVINVTFYVVDKGVGLMDLQQWPENYMMIQFLM